MNEWGRNREVLLSDLRRDGPGRFLWWPTCHKTIATGWHHPSIGPTYEWVSAQPEWQDGLEAVVKEGGRLELSAPPWLYSSTGLLGTDILQAYYYILLSRGFGRIPADIVEFGAGYGALARIIVGMGYDGTYKIVDVPEVVEIQRYYFGVAGILDRIEFVERVDTNGTLVSICSLSELPIEASGDWGGRDAVIDGAKGHFIVFQPEFFGENNAKYFEGKTGLAPSTTLTGHQYIVSSI